MTLDQNLQDAASEQRNIPQTTPSLKRASMFFVAGLGSFIGASLLLASI